MASGARNHITIYVPDYLLEQLAILPPRTISRVCQEALRAAVKRQLALREEAIEDAFAED